MRRQLAARQTAAPAETPISVEDLRSHLRIKGLNDSDEQVLLDLYIQAAVEVIEQDCGIALVTQTWTAKIDWGLSAWAGPSSGGWICDDEIQLPASPLQTVTSIKYIDGAGVEQTLDPVNYQVDVFSRPGRILRAYGKSWPEILPQRQAVTIVWQAGFGSDGAHVPARIKHAIRLLCGTWYANREHVVVGTVVNELPDAVSALLSPFKIYRFG